MYFSANNSAVAAISAELESTGLVVLRSISLGDFQAIGESLGKVRHHRDGLESGLTMIEADDQRSEQSAGAAFTRDAMPGHTDGSGVPFPSGLVLGHCTRPAARGGESTFVDMSAVYEHLSAESPETLAVLEDETNFSFGVSNLVAPVFSSGAPEVRVRFRDDGGLDVKSKVALNAIRELQRLIGQHEFVVDLAAGDAYVVDNFRVLHGRRAYSGDRLFSRLLVDPQGLALGIATGR